VSAGLDYHRGMASPEQAPPGPQKRPDLCEAHDHPGCTYNPRLSKTWCLCGAVTYPGDQATHADCCGGPLSGEGA